MISGGYVKTIDSSYSLEFRSDSGDRLIGKIYRKLSSLRRALPKILETISDIDKYKKHTFENNDILLACFQSGLIAYTSRFKSIKSAGDFMRSVVLLITELEDPSNLLNNCLEDKSKNVIRINKVSQFLDELEEINLPPSSSFYFRGHSSYLHKLQPGIYRNDDLIKNEHVIYNELLIRCPNDFISTASTFDVLVKMQHYSLPTRLLDLTTNPLVALYFACSNYKNDKYDGEVKVLNIPTNEVKYFDSDTVTVISNIAKQDSYFSVSCLNENESNVKLTHFLDDIKKEKSYFANRIKKKTLTSVVCVKPKLNNARIIRQDGAFLIFGMRTTKLTAAKIPTHYNLTDNIRFFIDNKSKESILMQLEKIGINEATIYPEIDKVSSYVSKRYGQPVDARNEEDEIIHEHKANPIGGE